MGLIKKDETFPARSVMIILVGTPFSYKTSLSLTAKKPILFDFEKGSERAHGRADTYRITTSWKEVETDLAAGLLDEFATVVADTGGALVDDYLWDYGREVKYTKNDMQNWGTVKDLFKKFFSFIRGRDKDLVVIAHEKSKDKNDETIYDLDISGGGKQLLLRQADQIGFISKRDFKENGQVITKTILTFNPTASLPFCKNVAGLADIVLPDCKSPEWEGFLDRVVIQPTRKAIVEMSEEQKEALQFIEQWRSDIDAIVPVEGDDAATDVILKGVTKKMSEIEPEHIKAQVRVYLVAHIAKIGWKYIPKPENVFKPITTAQAETSPPAKQQETPPATSEAEPPLDMMKEAENQRNTLAAEGGTTPVINTNQHSAEVKPDLFAKVPEGEK